MLFYGAMAAIYVVFGLWYYYGMKMFQEAAIPIQKYILGTIILGFLATAFQEIDLLFWNINGMRNDVLKYFGKSSTTGNTRCLQGHTCLEIYSNDTSQNQYLTNVELQSSSRCCRNSFSRFFTLFGGHGCNGLGCRTRHIGLGSL